ncbi:hypothetical protein IWQ60_008411 [Tieghemiomyces parasiticus]|uniref:Tyrosine specific protein phosphatases domain-containing protein n=1 Tax=Tieghemiomyces parasiticus TaxID=78921 RepID=A0A9W7ZT28_9FUNG|nr:hypothetical protein IWQ60_008411 [Tieghemiomyces parasiticus]
MSSNSSTSFDSYCFQRISNFRDVACSVYESSKKLGLEGTKRVPIKPRMLFRSARPDKATESDLEHITKNIGIKTIIDLRSEIEGNDNDEENSWYDEFPLAAAAVFSPISSLPHPDNIDVSEEITEPLTEPPSETESELSTASSRVSPPSRPLADRKHKTRLRKEDISLPLGLKPVVKQKRYNINLIGPRFRYGFVFKKAKFSTKSKLAYYQLRGMKQQMLDTVGREIFQVVGLTGFYNALLTYSAREIARTLKVFCNPHNYPILVHCSHGKDRTGIVIALILSLLGVDDRIIVDDYAKTRELMKDKIEEIKSDMRGTGMPDDFADAPPEAMAETLKHLRKVYQGASYYMELIGITKRNQERIRENLLVHTALGGPSEARQPVAGSLVPEEGDIRKLRNHGSDLSSAETREGGYTQMLRNHSSDMSLAGTGEEGDIGKLQNRHDTGTKSVVITDAS